MCYSLLWQERTRSQGTKFHPLRSRSWLSGGRSQLVAPAGPGPQTLPNCHQWGSLVPWTHLALRPPKWQGPAPTDGAPSRPPLPLVGTGRGRGGSLRCAGQGSGALQNTAPSLSPGPPDHPAAQGWVSWRAPRGGWGLPLTALSTWRPPLPQLLAESPTNGG